MKYKILVQPKAWDDWYEYDGVEYSLQDEAIEAYKRACCDENIYMACIHEMPTPVLRAPEIP